MLALVALSARRLAGWAAADGTPAVALDVFGDADTKALVPVWRGIGTREPPRIVSGWLFIGLRLLADRHPLHAFVAGSGFEGRLDMLAELARRLPMLGTAPSDQQRLADPREFFAALDAMAIPHPPVAFEPPRRAGWLRKRAQSAGGWGIDRSRAAADGVYWQRERAGVPMSATFVANGERAVVLGFNRQACAEIGPHPFVFAGVVGPLPVGDAVRREVGRALAGLVPAYRLRGLGSLDFVLGADGVPEVLELNARPSASAALYPRLAGASPLAAHVRACESGELPPAPPAGAVRGLRTVFTRRALQLGDAAAARIAATPGAQDLPRAGSRFGAGQPLCTIDAEGEDADAVEAALAAAANDILQVAEEMR